MHSTQSDPSIALSGSSLLTKSYNSHQNSQNESIINIYQTDEYYLNPSNAPQIQYPRSQAFSQIPLCTNISAQSMYRIINLESKISESRGNYELVKGVCFPDQTLRLEIQMDKNEDGTYQDQHVKTIIYMTSSNGKIPAGSISLVLNPASISEQPIISSIQKCPDKSATLSYTYTLDFLRAAPKSTSQTKTHSAHRRMEESGITHSSRFRVGTGSPSYNSLKNSQKLISFNGKGSLDKNGPSISASLYQINRDLVDQDFQDKKERISKFFDDASEGSGRKGIDIERKKTEKMKQTTRLIRQSSKKHHQQRSHTDQIYSVRLRQQLNQISNENQSLREKVRNLERKEKDQSQTIKELRQEMQRKKQKGYQQEFIKLENQNILQEKQKVIKEYQVQVKQFEEQISDLMISISTQNKRIQLKEVSLKDQLNRIQQKYQQSQAQRQRSVVEHNKMLEQLQASQKKNQVNSKQKDRVHAEEKNKLNKKIESLQRIIDEQKDELEESKTENADLLRQTKSLQAKLDELLSEASGAKMEGKNLYSQLSKEKEINKGLKKQIERLEELEKQLIQIRKNYQQLESTEQNSKRNLEISNKTITNMQSKIRQMEQIVVSKSQQISSLIAKSFSLNNQIQNFKKQQENYSREIQSLSQSNLESANKIEELRGKLDQSQMSHNELQTTSEQQISYMIKTKQYLESELQQSKWNCDKYKNSYEDITQKNRMLSEQIIDLNRSILQLQQKLAKQEQVLSDTKSTLSITNQSKQQQIVKQKQLQQKLKQKNTEIHQLNRKCSKIQNELYIYEQKQKHTEKYLSDKIESQEIDNHNKETKLNEMAETINKLQIEILGKVEVINELNYKINKLNLENEYLKEQSKTTKKQNAQILETKNELQEQLRETSSKYNSLVAQLDNEKTSKNQSVVSFTAINKQFEKYKLANSHALQVLVQQISKQYNPKITETTLAVFPDHRINSLQAEAIKKRNSLLQNYYDQIKSLTQNIKSLENQLTHQKKNFSEQEDNLENLLSEEKNKLKTIQAQTLLEKQQLSDKITMLEDRVYELTSENQKNSIEIQQNKSQILDYESLVSQLQFEVSNCKNEMKVLESNYKVQQEETLRTKSNFQNNLNAMNEESLVQMERLRKNISENDRKILNLEKILGEKEDQIRKLEANVQNITLHKEKSDEKVRELSNRVTESGQEKKVWIQNDKNNKREMQKLQNKISTLQASISQVNKRLEQLLIEKKKMEEILIEQEIEKKKLMGEIQVLNEQVASLQNVMRDSGDKNKRHVEKSAQDIKKFKQEVITLNSQIQLKQFEISQNQSTIKSLKLANQELTQQANQKKVEVNQFSIKMQENRNKIILLTQQLQTVKIENGNYEEQIRLMKENMINLEMAVDENKANFESLSLKDRQITKVKEENSIKEKSYERITQDLKSQVVQYKKQIAAKTQRQEEYKKKVRELESALDNQMYDLQTEHKTWEDNAEKEKMKLVYELEGVKEENKLLSEEFQFQREQMNAQLDQAANQNSQLRQTIIQNQMEINNTSERVTSHLQKIRTLEQQLDNCREQWLKEKGEYVPTKTHLKQIQDEIYRYQKYATELEKKNKQLTELAKRRLAEEPKSSCGDILRQVNTILLRNKTKILNKCGERERQQVVADFKQIHQKLQGAIKSYHLMK